MIFRVARNGRWVACPESSKGVGALRAQPLGSSLKGRGSCRAELRPNCKNRLIIEMIPVLAWQEPRPPGRSRALPLADIVKSVSRLLLHAPLGFGREGSSAEHLRTSDCISAVGLSEDVFFKPEPGATELVAVPCPPSPLAQGSTSRRASQRQPDVTDHHDALLPRRSRKQ